MSKKLTKDTMNFQKESTLQSINTLLSSFIDSSDIRLNKKASLLTYWLKSFSQYIDAEDSFDPTKLKSYKRGDIIKLNFGFNVGSEYGGLHYAIVINNNNPRNSSVLTVIPLTSQKADSKIHPNDVALGNELYRNIKLKYDTISQSLKAEEEEIEKTTLLINSILEAVDKQLESYDKNADNTDSLADAKRYLNAAKELQQEWELKSLKNKESSSQLEKIGIEIKRMKSGSIALVDQITTVSKMRIYDPRNAKGVLSGIRLSPESLDLINEKLKELFIF